MSENKEYIAKGQAHGDTAKAILGNNFSLKALAKQYRNLNFSSLPPNYWKEIDNTVEKVAREQLIGMRDIQRFGGFVNLDRRGVSVYEYYKVSDMSAGNFAMTPDERGTADKLDFAVAQLPLPIAKKEFWEEKFANTAASRNRFDLMMQLVDAASFSVANDLEEFLFNGEFSPAAGLAAYGYTKWPERNQYTDTLPVGAPIHFSDWKTAAHEDILKQVVEMVDILYDQNHYGPYKLYIPRQYAYIMSLDYTTGSNEYPTVGTVKQRLLQVEGVSEIEVSRKLADNNVLMVEMSPRSVKIVNGIPMTVMDWEPPNSPNWDHLYKAMACMVPLFISDYNGNNGILHAHL